MITITCVCNAGVGTSAFATGLVKECVEDLGYSKTDIRVECTELMGSRGLRCDLIITQKALVGRIPQGPNNPPVEGVSSLVSGKEEMTAAIKLYLEKAFEEGKIKKK